MFDGAQRGRQAEPTGTTAQAALLVALPPSPDDALVEEAIVHIRPETLSKTQHEALLPVSDLRGKVALAREVAAGRLTSRQLAERIADRGERSRGGGRRHPRSPSTQEECAPC